MDLIALAMINQLKSNGGAGHTKTSKQNILAEQNFVFNPNSDGILTSTARDGSPIVIGETYRVYFDGNIYECLCRGLTQGSVTVPFIGNASIMQVDAVTEMYGDTGEPFYIEDDREYVGNRTFSLLSSTEGTHTIAIYQETETIHTIDQKYIPPMDSITLNGADGKQYKLYVDESGELVTEAIE